MSVRNTNTTSHSPPRVLIFYDKPEEFLPKLVARFPTVPFFSCTTYGDLKLTIQKIQPQIVFASKFEPAPFPREDILECKSLEWLSVAFAGVDHVVPWDDTKLTVTNASGVAAEEMAQYVLAAIFGLFQKFPYFARRQAERQWDYQLIRSARGATVGLVGLGHTGESIARLCRAVGLKVVACRSTGTPSPSVDKVYPSHQLHDMLANVDVTVVCAALTPATHNLINRQAINAMKPGSFFINVARGAMVDEDALMEALKSQHIAGAVLDVVRQEPLPPENPLWDAPNLLITPHTSSEYEGWLSRAADMFAANLAHWLENAPLENRVHSSRGY